VREASFRQVAVRELGSDSAVAVAPSPSRVGCTVLRAIEMRWPTRRLAPACSRIDLTITVGTGGAADQRRGSFDAIVVEDLAC
jgi:hypothetical protein